LVAFAVAAFAASPDLTKLPPPATRQGVTYEKEIRPIFAAACLRCHGSERAKAGLRLDSLEATLKGSDEGKVIVPGKSDKSSLVVAVARLDNEKAMPPAPKPGRGPGGPGGFGPPPKPLTTEQVALIRAWVDQGAK
jgi:mono/diheme cytochrome c family protein